MPFSDPIRGLRLEAPAKINLYLHVLGRREDGYHLLDSLVTFTDFGDILTVVPSDALNLYLDGPFAGLITPDSNNLVLRAARALAEEAGIVPRADILLTKNIPVSAGLGGGSSDAAATLTVLQTMWKISIAGPRLMDIAASLGADIPVCLHGKSTFIGGVGEKIGPDTTLPSVGVVLVNPMVPVATPDVFRSRQGAFSQTARFDAVPNDVGDLVEKLRGTRNDLTEAAREHAPAVTAVLDTLDRDAECRIARLSGSGPTCFGIYENREVAEAAAKRVAAHHADWWVRAATLPRPTRPEIRDGLS